MGGAGRECLVRLRVPSTVASAWPGREPLSCVQKMPPRNTSCSGGIICMKNLWRAGYSVPILADDEYFLDQQHDGCRRRNGDQCAKDAEQLPPAITEITATAPGTATARCMMRGEMKYASNCK